TPTVGQVLCHPTGAEWPQSTDWQTVGGEFINKDGNATPVLAPCNLTTSDYYVEAELRPNQAGDVWASMGVLARVEVDLTAGPSLTAGYKGGFFRQTFCGGCGHAELDDILNSQQQSAEFGTYIDNAIYKVRLVVKGTDQRIYLNGKLVLEEHY